jgi:hypothetical protein
VLQSVDLAPIQRRGPHVYQRLAGRRLWLVDIDDGDVAFGAGGRDQGLHSQFSTSIDQSSTRNPTFIVTWN